MHLKCGLPYIKSIDGVHQYNTFYEVCDMCKGTGECLQTDCSYGYHREFFDICNECSGEGFNSFYVLEENLFLYLLSNEIIEYQNSYFTKHAYEIIKNAHNI